LLAALLRGDRTHGREQSRYALDLRGDARGALVLASANWRLQHEPADALALVRAARAARRAEAAAPVWQFLHETGGTDVRLGVDPMAGASAASAAAANAATPATAATAATAATTVAPPGAALLPLSSLRSPS
jgi:hypothetical protein